jgi:hypothetical protein
MFAVRWSLGCVWPAHRCKQTIGAADHQGVLISPPAVAAGGRICLTDMAFRPAFLIVKQAGAVVDVFFDNVTRSLLCARQRQTPIERIAFGSTSE